MGGSGESKGKKYEKSYFEVLGLCCSSEVPLIEKILKPLDGVHQVSVIVPSRTVIVLHDSLLISQIQIVKALNQARLEANVRVRGEKNYRKKWPSPFAMVCGVLLLLSFIRYAYEPFKWLSLGAVAAGILPIILKAIASLRNFRLDINVLMLIAVGGSIVLKDYWEAGTIVFLFSIAEWLESRASHKATAVMSSLMNIAPQRAVLAETGEEVDANQVTVNTKLAVKAGNIIPIDGIVVEGNSEVDEKTLTGESFPVAKQIDSTVWAGTINLNGYISVRTTALAEDCVVARMAKLVEEAQNNQSKTQRFIDKCAKYYTPAVVVVSAGLVVIPAALRVHNQSEWYHLALVVLVSACPCSLILSTPVATFCALSKAATEGVLIKGAEYLETLAKVKTVAFDKTGTITKGEFSVTNFQSLIDDVSLDTLLYWVSSIESKSSHPMAAALIDYAQSHSVEPKPDKVEEFQNFPGEGIYGKVDEKDIYVGNRKIAIRAGCETVPTFEGEGNEGKSTGYIFFGSSPAGIFSLSDVCRTGVREALKELKSMGIKTAMLTGDCQAATNHAQEQLDGALEEVHAELLPQDKSRIIKEFQNQSRTAMVGDGLNDAPALATADIGISMGISGSALATETGHIILMSNDIRKIPKAVKLARKTRRKIFENIFISVASKAGIISLAIAGHPLVWAAVLADVGTCLLVIFNSMLLLRGTPVNGKKHSVSTHGHKYGCKPTHSHSSHKHRNCSSGNTKVQDKCKPRKCSDSESKHGCCGHVDQTQEANKHLDHKSSKHCTSVAKVQGKCKPEKCCSGNSKCHDSENKLEHGTKCDMIGRDLESQQRIQNLDRSHKEHCHSKHSGQHMVAHENCHSKHSGQPVGDHEHCHSNHSGQPMGTHEHCHLGQPVNGDGNCHSNHSGQPMASHEHCHSGQPANNEGHCHSKHSGQPASVHEHCHSNHSGQNLSALEHCHSNNCVGEHVKEFITEEELGQMVRTCCEYYSINHSECKNSDVVECSSVRPYLTLEKRNGGGCCKSFRKECCGKSTQRFGVGFSGGLSEIVIE